MKRTSGRWGLHHNVLIGACIGWMCRWQRMRKKLFACVVWKFGSICWACIQLARNVSSVVGNVDTRDSRFRRYFGARWVSVRQRR